MTILGRLTQQPHEVIDYPVDFAKWFASRPSESIGSVDIVVESGLVLVGQTQVGYVVIPVIAIAPQAEFKTYKVEIRVTSDPSQLVKEAEFMIKVKEVLTNFTIAWDLPHAHMGFSQRHAAADRTGRSHYKSTLLHRTRSRGCVR